MRKVIVLLAILILFQICYSNDNNGKTEKIIQTQHHIFSHKQLITDGRVWDVAFEDLNKDGITDLVIANWFKPPTIYFNNGRGEFNKVESLPCSEVEKGIYNGHAIGIDDFNQDGVPDIFVVFNSRNNLLYSGEKTGGYSEGHTLDSNKSNGLYITLGDVDNDKDIDALITNYTQPTILWINDGKGQFVKNNFDFGLSGYNADLGDINNDGYPDVVCSVQGIVTVWFNNGNNNYVQSKEFIGYLKGFGRVKLADMDDDKDLDIVLANRSFGGSVWLNDVDKDGDLDLFYSTTIKENNLILMKNKTEGDMK